MDSVLKKILFFSFLLLSTTISFTQEPEATDDLGNVTDKFQEYFFEALKQKAIENYDRAVEALKKAAQENPDEAVVYFEMGKNYVHLEQYVEAEVQFQKALEMIGEKQEILAGLYDVYYHTDAYENAINVVKKLVTFDADYKEDLANLYVRTQAYDEALKILDELDYAYGNSDYRDQLRQKIYLDNDNSSDQISDLKNRIDRDPTNEQNYLNLIYFYSAEGQENAAFETALELLDNIPESDLAHLALYKFYLNDNQPEKAIASMKIIFDSSQVDSESKFKVLNDFLLFVNENPSYEDQLQSMIALYADKDNNPKVFQQLGDYYLEKNQHDKALQYFELGLEKNPTEFELLKQTALLQLDFDKNENAQQTSQTGMDLFPTQPLFYLLNGVAHNQLQYHKKAIEALETGLDFVLDDPKMERDFYTQLKEAYLADGQSQKAERAAQKINELSN